MIGRTLRTISRRLRPQLLALVILVAVAVGLVAASAQDSGRGEGDANAPAAPRPAAGEQLRKVDGARRKGRIRPNPRKAREDKPRVWDDRCEMGKNQTEIPRQCAYGDPNGQITVVLTGDSLASAYFPGINQVAKQKGWRLLSLTKVGCPPFRTLTYNNQLGRSYPECQRWHKALFERIDREQPGLIITMGWTLHKAWVNGKRLEPTSKRNRKRISKGYVKMLRTLRRRVGSPLAVLKDTPRAPFDVGPCVARHRKAPNRHCSYRIPREHRRQSFERSVTRQVWGATLVDLTPVLCPRKRCRAVFGDKLVLRDKNHPTATFAKTLGPPLAERLPEPAGAGPPTP